MNDIAVARLCENCDASIDHKRRDARFCDRTCKMAHWHKLNRATEDGKARERVRNTARYANEADRRRAQAVRDYYDNHEKRVEYSRTWRRENPHRRREQHDRRADLMRTNPGFVPFGLAEWERLKRRFGHRCAYCGARSEVLEQDHVVPLSRGGRHAIANILPACPSCNRAKSGFLLSEWRYRPRGR